MAKVVIVRLSEFVNVFRNYKIFIDGLERNIVPNNASVELDLESGTHFIQLKIDWCTSNEIEFEIAENETKYFQVEAAKWASLLMFYYITFGRKSFLKLSRLV